MNILETLTNKPSFYLCHLLKDKGFNDFCSSYYRRVLGSSEIVYYKSKTGKYKNADFKGSMHDMVAVPSYDEIINWLREIKFCYIEPKTEISDDFGNVTTIWRVLIIHKFSPEEINNYKDKAFYSYRNFTEETIDKAIESSLNLIK